MNSANYIEILESYLVPFGRDTFNGRYFLHQDNSSIHRSDECDEYITAERIRWVLRFKNIKPSNFLHC